MIADLIRAGFTFQGSLNPGSYTHHIFHIVLACATDVIVYAWICFWKCLLGIVPVPNCSQIHSAWRGDKVNSGIGLSYWPARLHRLGGTLCRNQLHSIVRDFEFGNCIHSRKSVTNDLNNYMRRQHLLYVPYSFAFTVFDVQSGFRKISSFENCTCSWREQSNSRNLSNYFFNWAF